MYRHLFAIVILTKLLLVPRGHHCTCFVHLHTHLIKHTATLVLSPAQIRRPSNYDGEAALVLGPSTPDPTVDISQLDICRTVVEDSPHKLFVGGLPCDWTEDQVRCTVSLQIPLLWQRFTWAQSCSGGCVGLHTGQQGTCFITSTLL